MSTEDAAQADAAIFANAIAVALVEQLRPTLDQMSARIQALSDQIALHGVLQPVHTYAMEAMKHLLQDEDAMSAEEISFRSAELGTAMLRAIDESMAKFANSEGGDADSTE